MAQQKQLSKDKQEAILKRFLPGIHRWQQDYKHGMDGKRAAAALRRFDRQDKQGILTDKYGGKHRVYDAGGMIGSSEIDSIRNADGERIHSHDLEFHRKGTGGSAYDKTKRPMTDAKRDTRQKIIKQSRARNPRHEMWWPTHV